MKLINILMGPIECIAVSALLLLANNCGNTGSSTETPIANAAASKPIKVLVRNRNTGMLAVDGILFQVHLLATEQSPEMRDRLRLLSDNSIMDVIEESGIEYRSPAGDKQTPTPSEWTNDPKAFDFFVTWTHDAVEQTKRSFNADLVLNVKEDWKVEKVDDPTVTKSWNCSYTIRAPGSYEKELLEKTSLEQTSSQIVPNRGPIIDDLRSFIAANRQK